MKKSTVLMVCFLLVSQVVGQAASQVPQNSYNVRRAGGHDQDIYWVIAQSIEVKLSP